jgi:hypothetical protein
MATLDPAFSAEPKAEDQTSDAPVAHRDLLGFTQVFPRFSPRFPLGFHPGFSRRPRTDSTALRQQERLSRPGAPFIDNVSRLRSQALPATDPATLPPRSGFRRSFTQLSSRSEKG